MCLLKKKLELLDKAGIKLMKNIWNSMHIWSNKTRLDTKKSCKFIKLHLLTINNNRRAKNWGKIVSKLSKISRN